MILNHNFCTVRNPDLISPSLKSWDVVFSQDIFADLHIELCA